MFKIIKDVDNYIEEIIQLDNKFYKEEYTWSDEYQKAVYERNKDSFIAVTNDNKLVGYLNFLNISDNVYNQMLKSNVIIDEYDLKDIMPFTENNNILICSIVIDKEYQNTGVVKYLTDGLLARLKELEKNNYHIKTLSGTAVSEDGQKLLKILGLTDIKLLDDNNHLFINDKDVVKNMENSINILKSKKNIN